VPIFARARNRFHSHKLMDLGVKIVVRETLHSSVELARGILNELGVEEDESRRIAAAFLEFDQKLLVQQHAVYQDEEQLIQTSKQAADELRSLFEAAERDTELAAEVVPQRTG
jgi:voltage-gated potassium channel Kch